MILTDMITYALISYFRTIVRFTNKIRHELIRKLHEGETKRAIVNQHECCNQKCATFGLNSEQWGMWKTSKNLVDSLNLQLIEREMVFSRVFVKNPCL